MEFDAASEETIEIVKSKSAMDVDDQDNNLIERTASAARQNFFNTELDRFRRSKVNIEWQYIAARELIMSLASIELVGK